MRMQYAVFQENHHAQQQTGTGRAPADCARAQCWRPELLQEARRDRLPTSARQNVSPNVGTAETPPRYGHRRVGYGDACPGKKKPPENRRHSAGCPATGLQRQAWTPGLRDGRALGRTTSDNVTGGSVTAPRSQQQQSGQTPDTPQPDRKGTAPTPKKGWGRNQYSSAGLTERAARLGRAGRRAAERLSVEASSSAARQAASSWGESG